MTLRLKLKKILGEFKMYSLKSNIDFQLWFSITLSSKRSIPRARKALPLHFSHQRWHPNFDWTQEHTDKWSTSTICKTKPKSNNGKKLVTIKVGFTTVSRQISMVLLFCENGNTTKNSKVRHDFGFINSPRQLSWWRTLNLNARSPPQIQSPTFRSRKEKNEE